MIGLQELLGGIGGAQSLDALSAFWRAHYRSDVLSLDPISVRIAFVAKDERKLELAREERDVDLAAKHLIDTAKTLMMGPNVLEPAWLELADSSLSDMAASFPDEALFLLHCRKLQSLSVREAMDHWDVHQRGLRRHLPKEACDVLYDVLRSRVREDAQKAMRQLGLGRDGGAS